MSLWASVSHDQMAGGHREQLLGAWRYPSSSPFSTRKEQTWFGWLVGWLERLPVVFSDDLLSGLLPFEFNPVLGCAVTNQNSTVLLLWGLRFQH